MPHHWHSLRKSGKRSTQQRSLPTNTESALRCHISLIHLERHTLGKKLITFSRWVRFVLPQRHLHWKRTHGYFALPPCNL